MQLNGQRILLHGSIPIERSDRVFEIEYEGERAQIFFGYDGNFSVTEPLTASSFVRHLLLPGHFITASLTPGSKNVLRCCLEPFSELSPAFYILTYLVFADERA